MLSPRLLAIYKLIPHCRFLADIGCDHGFIPIEAVKSGLSERAAACDISKGSLEKADKNIRFSGLADKIEVRLGGGLDAVSHFEADVIIIAGMGGLLIADILKKGFGKIGSAKLILQPMTAVPELREALLHSGFKITDEELVREDKRIYNIISAETGNMNSYEYETGERLIEKKHPLLKPWLEERIRKENSIISKIPETSEDFTAHSLLIKKYREALEII